MRHFTVVVMLTCSILCLSHCKKNSEPEKPKKVMVTTIAGTGEIGYLDATAAFAKFNQPSDVAVHTDGTIYIADRDNRRIRKLDPNGLVYTVAGSGNYGGTNGSVTTASFKEPSMISLDAAGNLYVLDRGIHQVRKISGGTVSVFAGTGTLSFHDGRADSAHFSQPSGIAIDGNGIIYLGDTYNYRVRKIANGYVSTVAGTGTPGYLDGNGAQAQFFRPRGTAIDKQGNLYICDDENYRIRKITPGGIVSTLAGNGTAGKADGSGGNAQFFATTDIVIDSKGNLYVSDSHTIRKITAAGEVTTIAGGEIGFADGQGNQAQFSYLGGLGIDGAGNIYVADLGNDRIRKITFE